MLIFIMTNNEPLNSSDMPEENMTVEEYRLYREILESAYPKPKKDIKKGVMDAIRAESAKSNDYSDAIILPGNNQSKNRPKKKKFSTQTFVKWGSLAASIVIIAGVGIKVLPALLTPSVTYDTASQDQYSMTATSAYNSYESAPEENTAAYDSENDGFLYKSVLSQDNEAMANPAISDEYYEEAAAEAVVEDAVVEEAVEEAAEDAEFEISTTADYTESETGSVFYDVPDPSDSMIISAETEANVEPIINCAHTEVFRDSYHEIPSFLIDEVGADEYYAWANSVTRDDSCAVNIYNFVHHFGISQAMFAMYLSQSDIAYYCDYPIDILYECSAEEADEYYRNGGRYAEMVKDYFEYEFKLTLISEIGTEAYTEWLSEVGCSSIRGWSISQMVLDNSIDAVRFGEIYDKTVKIFSEEYEEYEGYALPEYDLARVYVPNAGTSFALAMGITGYSADVACRK